MTTQPIALPVRSEQDPACEFGYWRLRDDNGNTVLSLCERAVAEQIEAALNATIEEPDEARADVIPMEGTVGEIMQYLIETPPTALIAIYKTGDENWRASWSRIAAKDLVWAHYAFSREMDEKLKKAAEEL